MILFSYSGAPSNRGLDQRLYGLNGVGNVPGGVWVVLELEWGSRTPPTEFCRDHLTSPPTSSSHFTICFSFCGGFFQPQLRLSLFLGSGDGRLACFSFVFQMFMKGSFSCCIMIA